MKNKNQIKFSVLAGLSEEVYTPKAQTKLSAGLDVCSTKTFNITPGEVEKVNLGVVIKSIPDNLYLALEVRSSLRFKYQLTQLGTGIIDTDFKGPIMLLLKNEGKEPRVINEGDRIAQLIPKENLTLAYCKNYIKDEVRSGGFGSTDKEKCINYEN